MTIFITTIPDDPKAWAGWLEQHLVGLRLRDVIDELRLLPGSTSTPLQDLLNQNQLSQVRQGGLSALPMNQIRGLLGSPESLLELQEEILINGGEYWASLPPAEDLKQATERVRRKLKNALSPEQRGKTSLEKPTATRTRSKFVVGLVSAAAILLIGVFAWRMQPAGSGSILGQPGLLANDVSSSAAYFNRIAAAGNEWFDEHPCDSAQLISLLTNVSNDCQILIDADHKALSIAERDWLVAKCTNWKNKFDATLVSLQSAQLTFELAKREADDTMHKLVAALQAGPNA